MTRTAWIAGIAGAALVLGGTALRGALGIEWSADSVRELVEGAGAWAPVAFTALVALRLLILVPSQILLIAAGLLFGAAAGTVYGAIGMTLSALINFAFIRIAGVDAVREYLPRRFDKALVVARSNVGAGVLAVATGYPVGPISAVQMGAALAGMSLLSFCSAVAIGATVRAATYSYLGSTIFAGGNLLLAVAALAAVATVPLLFPGWRARLAGIFAGSNPPPEG